jgi:hypothetical protein
VRAKHTRHDQIVPALGLQKHLVYVLGRPVLILQLTHPRATREEGIPYLKSVLSPAQVLQVMGRSATLGPQCHRHHAVFHGWRQSLLPLILSPQIPPDTYVLVFEADYRFAQEHAQVCREYEEEEPGLPSTFEGYGGGAAQSSSGERSAPQSRGGRGGEEADTTPWWIRHVPFRTVGGRELGNPLLEDLVSFGNQAAKRGRGDLVWYSWLGAKKKGAQQPSRASTLIGLSKRGAAELANWLTTLQPQHLDVALANSLRAFSPGLENLRGSACYIWNPVGGFQEHVSGCEDKLVRTEEWDRFQPWTRRLGKYQARWLVSFGEGTVQSRCVATLSEDRSAALWRTYLPSELLNADGSPNLDEITRRLRISVERSAAEEAHTGSSGEGAGESASAPSSAAEAAALDVPPEGAASASLVPLPTVPEEDTRSIYSEEQEDAEPTDPAIWQVAQAKALAGRERKAQPTEAAYSGREAELTKHRLRQRRAAALRYWQFRHMTTDPVPTHLLRTLLRLPCV